MKVQQRTPVFFHSVPAPVEDVLIIDLEGQGPCEGVQGVNCTGAQGQKGGSQAPKEGSRNVFGSQKMLAYMVMTSIHRRQGGPFGG